MDAGFLDSLILRGEKSKLCATIGSCNISNDKSIFDLKATMAPTWDDMKSSLQGYIDEDKIRAIDAEISFLYASWPTGISKENLSKFWMVSKELAQGAIDQNTQLVQHSNKNLLSRQYSTDD